MLELELNGKQLELKYSIGRVEKIEATLGRSFGEMVGRGAFMLTEMKVLMGYALKYKEDGGGFLSPDQGMKFTEELIMKEGTQNVQNEIAEALMRDCPFFFRLD